MLSTVVIGVSSRTDDHLRARCADYLPAGCELQILPVPSMGSETEAILSISRLSQGPSGYQPFPVNGIIVRERWQGNLPADIPLCTEAAFQETEQRQLFIAAASACAEFDAICAQTLNAHTLIQFHSRYKMLLLAHSQQLYRELGPLVGGLSSSENLNEFSLQYRRKLLKILALPSDRRDNTNVLMHLQGYFRPFISSARRQQLAETIDEYRRGLLPLSVPQHSLRNLLAEYPHPWLASQRYLFPYLSQGPEARSSQEMS